MTSLDSLWVRILTEAGHTLPRATYRFDPELYAAQYPDIVEGGLDPAEHYKHHGQEEGRIANQYQRARLNIADLDMQLADLVIDEELSQAIEEGVEGACELAFELIVMGSPIDEQISDFSEEYYLTIYPDISAAGVSPFQHYIQHGLHEGRRSVRDVRRNQLQGNKTFNPAKPTCLICVHELSKTGAPIVGLKLVREAAETHNVVVAALRGGQIQEEFRENACVILLSEQPGEDLKYFKHPALDQVSFALLNSVECFFFAKALVPRDIPFACYLHEFSNYTLPAYKMIVLAAFADLLVFSSEAVMRSWQPFFNDLAFDKDRDTIIIPQHDLVVGQITTTEYQAARRRVEKLIGRSLEGKKLIFGAGHAQWRKGTDLFVLTAQAAKHLDEDTIFLWVGDGLNHEDVFFGVWMDKHIQEAKANKPDGNLYFLPAGNYYLDVARAADAMFLSSRLDPLPNVVFDAMRLGCQVVKFDSATGFDDPLYDEVPELHGVPFGDLTEAAKTLLGLPAKSTVEQTSDEEVPEERLFGLLSLALENRLRLQRKFVVGAGDYDIPFMFSSEEKDQKNRILERQKIWSMDRRFMWKSKSEATAQLAASDNWYHKDMAVETFDYADHTKIKPFCVHIHAHYIDDLGEDLSRFVAYRHAERLVITTNTKEKEREINEIAQRAQIEVEVLVGSNRGRDILPFMELFHPGGPAGDGETWCHIHQKKSIGSASTGDVWRDFLMTILLGGKDYLSSAIDLIGQDENGLVSAFDPYIVGWAGSQRLLPQFEHKLPGPLPEHPILFPVGNMFWTKSDVVRQMNSLFGTDYPWPNEPLPNDGTVYHMIERLWPAAAVMTGKRSVFIDKPDQRRS